MGRSKSDVRQGDIQRALKAAKVAGLNVVRVEVDPKIPRIVLVLEKDGKEQQKIINPLDNAPSFWAGRRKRK